MSDRLRKIDSNGTASTRIYELIEPTIKETSSVSSDEEVSEIFATKESGIHRLLEDKDKYIARRNALLK